MLTSVDAGTKVSRREGETKTVVIMSSVVRLSVVAPQHKKLHIFSLLFILTFFPLVSSFISITIYNSGEWRSAPFPGKRDASNWINHQKWHRSEVIRVKVYCHFILGQCYKTFRRQLLVIARSRGLHYKTFWISNLRKIERFCSKLVSFLLPVAKHNSLDKHTSLLHNP